MQEPRIINLPKLESDRGNLSIIEGNAQIPFGIRRVAWIYDVPGGEQRGAHAYRRTQEFIVALSGSFDVVLHDGTRQQTFPLNRSYYGLYVPQGWWRMMNNFSTNAVALVVASTDYDEDDYIWDFNEFKVWRNTHWSSRREATLDTSGMDNGQWRMGNGQWAARRDTSRMDDCKLYELTKFHHKEGNLTYVYPFQHVPFEIKRVFYSYDIPSGKHRGAHAHKSCHQVIVAASGSFDILLDDGTNQKRVQLNRPFLGLHIPPGIWAQEENFSSGAICLVLASEDFDQDDYIREYDEYLEYIKK